MLTSLALSANIVLRKPQLLAIALVAAAIVLGIFFLTADILLDFIVSSLFLEIVPDTGFFELPWHFYLLYSSHINILAVALLAITTVFVWLGVFFSVFARDSLEREASMLNAAREAWGKTRTIIATVLFFFLIALLFFILLWWLVNATIPLGAIGIIFPIILLLTGFFLYITLLFVIPIIAIEKATLKEAIQKSFGFAKKRFWHVVLLGIVVGLINAVILNGGEYVSRLIADETIAFIVFAVFWAIAVSFVNLALPVYYLRKSGG